MVVRVGLWRKLSAEELMHLNCGVGEDSWASLGPQGPVHPKWNQSWIFIGRTDVEAETPILWLPDATNWFIWKDPDTEIDWRQEEKGTTGWDGWMTSPTWWTWIWVSSRCWWWTGNSGMLQSVGWQRVRPNWVTELTDLLGSKGWGWSTC